MRGRRDRRRRSGIDLFLHVILVGMVLLVVLPQNAEQEVISSDEMDGVRNWLW